MGFEMYKINIENFAWDSKEYDDWRTTIASLASVEVTESTKYLSYMEWEYVNSWPWQVDVAYLYDVSKFETIVLTFKSKDDWDECRKTPEFEDALDFDNLDFFEYLNVEICKVTKIITKGYRPIC